MATRNDITVIQQLSPRVAEVAQPSTEVVMQDYVDTLRVEEQAFQSLGFNKLLNASGKEQLDDTTIVAITVQEQNLQLAFEPRFDPAQTGTVTTGSGPVSVVGRYTFEDTSADFIAAGVIPGSYMINWTDRSVTDVVRVISATVIETKQLRNGTDNEWDIGDAYSLWNITQVRTTGGNLVAVDEDGVTQIPAVLPTWGTQVILATSSSATISELEEIRFAAYGNGVTFDPMSPKAISGTDYPAGTLAVPSDNWDDVIAIGNTLGLNKIFVRNGSYVVPENLDLSNEKWIIGEGATITSLIIPDSANTTNLRVQDVTLISSYLDQTNLVERSVLIGCFINTGANPNVQTIFFSCAFSSTITFSGNGQANIFSCYSAVAGAVNTPTFIINDVLITGRNWEGGCEFQSKTSGGGFSWDMSSGQVVVNDNNASGIMTFRGIGKWTNRFTYAGTAVVNNELLNEASIADAVWNALVASYNAAGSFGQLVGRKLLTVAKYFALR